MLRWPSKPTRNPCAETRVNAVGAAVRRLVRPAESGSVSFAPPVQIRAGGVEPRSVQRQDCERFRGHPWFDATVEFCERYDENCFDPAYEWLPLNHFAPAVDEVFSREPSFR
jgi:hypothetical protein